MSDNVPYLITTMISGVPNCICCNVEEKKFELMPVTSDSDLGKVFTSPTKTEAVNILNWVNANDKKLARKKLTVQAEASIRGRS